MTLPAWRVENGFNGSARLNLFRFEKYVPARLISFFKIGLAKFEPGSKMSPAITTNTEART